MSDLKTFALFSELVYEPDGGASKMPAGWVRLETSDRAGIPTTAGYFGAAYRNTATREIVIAHRGTNLFSLADWGPNTLAAAAGRIPSQFLHARQFDDFVRENFLLPTARSTPITQIGHSLGGGLAAMVAVANRQSGAPILDRAFTFNPIGVQGALQTAGFSTTDLNYVRNIAAWFDPASRVGTRVGVTENVHVPLVAGVPAFLEAVVASLGIQLAVALGVGVPAYLLRQHSIVPMRETLDALPPARIQQLAPDLALTSDWNFTGSLASYLQPLQDLAARDPGFADILQNTSFENPQDAGIALVQEQSSDLSRSWSYVGTGGADLQIGGSGADRLSGGGGTDVQYGGAGADCLEGGAGADWLIGGTGFDTYVYRTGDGNDRIVDEDRQGQIVIDDTVQRNFAQVSQGIYRSTDGQVTLIQGASWTLSLSDGSSIDLGDTLNDGDFGINLRDAQAAHTDESITLTLAGDLQPVDFDPSTPGTQTQIDSLGNVIVTNNTEPGRADTLYGDASGNLIAGLGGNDTLSGRAGDDDLYGGDGDDVVLGEAGWDDLYGGAGRDFLDGGADDDDLYGGAGDDALQGGLGYDRLAGQAGRDLLAGQEGDDELHAAELIILSELPAALAAGETQAGSGLPGDLLDGGSGEDIVLGDQDDDAVFGAGGADVLAGGGGADNVLGDWAMSFANPGWVANRSMTTQPDGTTAYTLTFTNVSYAIAVDGGDDELYGGAGEDWLFGNLGDDYLDGGADNDVLFGHEGFDVLFGGAGDDVLVGDDGDLPAEQHADDYLDGEAGADTLYGGGGADQMFGGLGNDRLYGDDSDIDPTYQGDDYLDGEEGDDELYGFGGNDTLYGGTGLDLLAGGAGDDYLDGEEDADQVGGGDGNDVLFGGSGADTIGGDAGDDYISGEDDDDLLDGGAGNDAIFGDLGADQLQGSTGDDMLMGGGGEDMLFGEVGADVLSGGDGNDQITGGDDNDTLSGDAGNDLLWGDAGNDLLAGGDGIDQLQGGDGSDTLDGGADNDQLQGEGGNDVMDGGDGADSLFAGTGDDTLTGGAGDDVLLGEAGNDVYLFNLGDRQDAIFEQADTAFDVVRFGPGIIAEDVTFSRTPDGSLVAWHANGVDQLTIANWYFGIGNQVARFEFADGTQFSASDAGNRGLLSLRGTDANDTIFGSSLSETLSGLGGNDALFGNAGNDTLIGGRGNDTLVGGAGADTIRFSLGDGADRLQGAGTPETTDTMILGPDIASTDVTYDRVGNNLVMRHVNGIDSVTVENWFEPISYKLQSVVFASDGSTRTTAQLQDLATNISHQYTLNLGDSAKLIEDWGGTDTLSFGAGIAKADIQKSRVGADLVLAHINGTDRVTIKGWFDNVNMQVENVSFSATGESFTHVELTDPFLTLNGTTGNDLIEGGNAYGETINGLAGNDVIHGLGGNDSITGGLGNDTLYGGTGIDRYYFNLGNGQDIIADVTTIFEGQDALILGSGIVDNFSVTFQGPDVLFSINGTNDSVRMVRSYPYYSNLEYRFTLLGTAGADALTGSQYVDEIFGGSGNDTLQGGNGADYLYGGDGDDLLDAQVLADGWGEFGFYNGGRGNDTIYGNSQEDHYYFALGDGQDLIIEQSMYWNATWYFSGYDQLTFGPGITANTLSTTRSGSDLIVNVAAGDRITLQNWFGGILSQVDLFAFDDGTTRPISEFAYTQRGTAGNDTLTGSEGVADTLYGMDGNDVLSGLSGDDILDGGAGNDTVNGGPGHDQITGGSGVDLLNGGDGNDTYFFGMGAGQDIVSETDGGDAVQFDASLTASTIVLGRNVNSLVLGINGTADSLTINDYFVNAAFRVENFVFADGSQLPGEAAILDQFLNIRGTAANDVLTGSTGFDVMYGFDGHDTLTALADNDTLYGGAENDTLNGGPGNDNLQGEGGNDTYLITVGDGQDVVLDTAGFDAVVFGAGIAATAVATIRSSSNLVLNVNVAGNPSTVTVQNYFNGQETEEIRFADGTLWNVEAVRAKVLAAESTSGNDQITGFDGNDTINSLAGSDIVYGRTGNDVIDGGLGSDTLYGEDGNDLLIAGTGESKNASITNLLYGGNGNDVLVSSGKTDRLFGEGGNDILIGGALRDWLEDSGGNNLIVGGATLDDIWMGDQNDLVIAGTGNDLLDGDRNADGIRGRDILAFNKSDGVDSVSRLGSGSAISIGGGTLYSNLFLEVQGTTLRLKTGSNHYISLNDWYGNPANRTVSTLQIVIEGTRDYNANSSNPMNNRKIQVFDFLRLVAAFDAAGRPSNFNVAANLASVRLWGSDTEAFGGAIAYQYARTGAINSLTYDQMRAVISAPTFGVSAQPITASATASTLEQASSADTTPTLMEGAVASATLPENDGERLIGDPGSSPLPNTEVVAGVSAGDGTRAQLSVEVITMTPMLGHPTPVVISHGLSDGVANAVRMVFNPNPSSALTSTPISSIQPSSVTPDEISSVPLEADYGDSAIAGTPGSLPAEGEHPREDASLSRLVDQWFGETALHADLSLLDDIARGDDGVTAPRSDSVLPAWEHSHHWLDRLPLTGDDGAAGDTHAAGLPWIDIGNSQHDAPYPAVGLHNVSAHNLRSFSGLREGVTILDRAS